MPHNAGMDVDVGRVGKCSYPVFVAYFVVNVGMPGAMRCDDVVTACMMNKFSCK